MPKSQPPELLAAENLVESLRRHLQATHGVPVQLIETHISWVLLTQTFAYKIKKPVQLGFIDFSTLALRKHFCEEELRLNRRLAPSIYLAVVEIRGTLEAPNLDGPGPVLDVALKMRRFEVGALFSEQLVHGSLQTQHVDRLASRLAVFHRTAPQAEPSTLYGSPSRVECDAWNAFVAVESALPVTAAADLRAWLQGQISVLRPEWAARREAGWVRECHGDLHLGNVVLLGDDATAFDCIEFDPALRWIDVMSDVSFLVMDLLAHHRRDLAFRFLNAWLEASGDYAGLTVLRFYMAYRALVRAQVALIRSRQAGGADSVVPDYGVLACRLAREADPRLLITHGLPGSGKTFAAQHVLEQVGAIRIRSDVERKRLFGLAALQSSTPQERATMYAESATQRTYERLHAMARTSLQAGWPTLIDAAFLGRSERAQFHALAVELRVPFAILDCEAPLDVLRDRIRARQARQDDASEADVTVLEHLSVQHEALSDAERAQTICVDTQKMPDAAELAAQWLGRTAAC